MDVIKTLKSKTLESIFYARSGLYFLEGFPLVYMDQWIQHGQLSWPKSSLSESVLINEVKALVQADVENIKSGVYSLASVRREKPISHLKNLYKIYKDSIIVSKNKKSKKAKVFSLEASKKLKKLPKYYQRNFHYQIDGYLSEDSAQVYDHQVEILFRGTADIMRRRILKPMAQYLGSNRRLQILEVGCGTGAATFPVAKLFKQSRIKAIDISDPYIEFCNKDFADIKNVSFAQGQAESLDNIKTESQDAWYSVYMFHELPQDVREKTLAEAYRVLKPGGYVFILDSVQHHDRPDFKTILDMFPKNFHEPFYKNYVNTPLESLLEDAGFIGVETDLGFVSKVCWAQKPISN